MYLHVKDDDRKGIQSMNTRLCWRASGEGNTARRVRVADAAGRSVRRVFGLCPVGRRRTACWIGLALLAGVCGLLLRYWALNRAALDIALFNGIRANNCALVHAALEQGADPDAVFGGGTSAWDQIEYLIHHGASLTGLRSTGCDTALMYVFNGRARDTRSRFIGLREYPAENMAMVADLVAHGASVNVTDANGMTPLYHAVVAWQVSTSVYLLDHGADPNFTAAPSSSPLLACADGCAQTYGATEQVVDLMIAKGADVNCRDTSGRSALQIAARWSPEVVAALLEHGAKPNLRDNRGDSPLTTAYNNWPADSKMINMLEEHGAVR